MTNLREQVRESYAAAATSMAQTTGATDSGDGGCGCSPEGCCGTATASSVTWGGALYGESASEVPDTARLASLGCGNPTAVAELRPGETVLDLGSGGGLDALLSAARVGPSGKVYGLDMTEEMLALALENRRKAAVTNVEFLKGYIEEVPLPADTVDAIISNCVVNLSVDKPRVFREMHRVLRPGGRIGIADIVAANELTPDQRAARGGYVECIAGALSFEEYESGLREAGFADVSVTPTHDVADGLFSAIIRARKPSA